MFPETEAHAEGLIAIFANLLVDGKTYTRPLRRSLRYPQLVFKPTRSHAFQTSVNNIGKGPRILLLCIAGLQVSEVVGIVQQGRRKWYLLGQRMSPKCVVAALGIGNFRTLRLQQGRKDRRFRLWGGVH